MTGKPDAFPEWLRDLETAEPRPPVAPAPDDADENEETPEDHDRPSILNALHGCA
jgi:hypothetical protein